MKTQSILRSGLAIASLAFALNLASAADQQAPKVPLSASSKIQKDSNQHHANGGLYKAAFGDAFFALMPLKTSELENPKAYLEKYITPGATTWAVIDNYQIGDKHGVILRSSTARPDSLTPFSVQISGLPAKIALTTNVRFELNDGNLSAIIGAKTHLIVKKEQMKKFDISAILPDEIRVSAVGLATTAKASQ